MNVWMPTDKPELMNYAVIIFTVLGVASGIYAFREYKKEAFVEWLA